MLKLYTKKQLLARIEAAVAEAIVPLRKQIEALKQENARLKKNSSNSSKPPSSDIVKPPKEVGKNAKGKRKRKQGGQKGHPKHDRKAFTAEEVTVRHPEYTLDLNPAEWEALDQWETHQMTVLRSAGGDTGFPEGDG